MKTSSHNVLITCFFLLMLGSSALRAQEINSKMTAIFIYNFAKQIEWPPQAETGNFVIGVLGNTPVTEELRKGAQITKVRNRSIVIKQITSLTQTAELATCHIIFVSEKEGKLIKDLAKITEAAPVLVVSEGIGMIRKGSFINLFLDEEEDRAKFEMNKPLLDKHGLKATNALVSLAILL